MANAKLSLLLAALIVPAGCLGGDEASVEPTSEDPSGGSGSPAQDNATDPGRASSNASASAEPGPIVVELNASYTASAATSGAGDVVFGGGERVLEVPISGNASALVAELTWTGTGDLDLSMLAPGTCSGPGSDFDREAIREAAGCIVFFPTGEGKGVASTSVTDPAIQDPYQRLEIDASTIETHNECEDPPCDWQGYIHTNVAVEVDATLRVSVFATGEVPEDYTAFEP